MAVVNREETNGVVKWALGVLEGKQTALAETRVSVRLLDLNADDVYRLKKFFEGKESYELHTYKNQPTAAYLHFME